MSTTTLPVTPPQVRTDPVEHDVLRPRPRRTIRREIIAVLVPAWHEPGDDVTSHRRPPASVAEQAAGRLAGFLQHGEVVTATDDGRLVLRLRRADRAARPVRLQEMAYHAVEVLDGLGFDAGVLDLGVGWARVSRKQGPEEATRQATRAAADSIAQRDFQPRQRGAHVRERNPSVNRWTLARQVAAATLGGLVLPFLALVLLHQVGLDVSDVLYWVLVGSLALTAAAIWSECAQALDPPRLPDAPDRPAPRASAVLAAYLPNEADTIVETVRTFLAQEYAGGLQVVLAYNTPTLMPVEAELRQLAQDHEQLTVIKVPDSTSKAQNVNAALRVVDGEFVGIFDADHHPMPGAFERAWRWIADGADVVQGHCVIRNADESWLTRLVAVEFEQLYAVSHPGRAALHGFGIFGGSNGYWRTSALEQVRLRASFLTEDIEASMRTLEAGGRIVSDPGLVSRELAPDTVAALWAQRMRWAQGWFQVSCRHLGSTLRSPRLTLRQKLGVTYLLGWREVYPWIVMSAWPLLGFLAWRDGGLDFASPIFLAATAFVTLSGPLQTLTAWRLAAPELRQHPRWFAFAALANVVAYVEFKNVIGRVAHLKQLRGERRWVVTPRTAPSSATTDAPIEEAA